MFLRFYKKKKNSYYTNFLPLIVNSFLRKGEKEKTFVKVNKVLTHIKKTLILNDCFFANKYIFNNKAFCLITKKKFLIDSINYQKTRYDLDFFIKNKIYFFITNLYPNDFLQYKRYIQKLNEIKKKKLVKKNYKKSVKILIRKQFLNKIKFKKFNFLNLILFFSKNKYFYHNNILSLQFVDLNLLINKLYKKILKLNKNYMFIFNKFNMKNKTIFLFNFKKINLQIYFLKLNKKIVLKKKKKIKKKKKEFKKFYYLSDKIKNLQKQHKQLDKKYFLLKKVRKKMNRFEFKKRRSIYRKLQREYKKSRKLFFAYKRKRTFIDKINYRNKLNFESYKNKNYGKKILMKLYVIKKTLNINKNVYRKKFFNYSLFPNLFNPSKFFNICLSYYRLFFTFKDQRFWGKQRLIPSIINLKRDIRITVRNFKKSLYDDRFLHSNFLINFYENIVFSGGRKGFLIKLKKKAYIFMIKNAIFLQFMVNRRKRTRRRRRKKINRK